LVEALEASGIEHMLTGSIVSSLQGAPRATHDIDVVVALRGEDAPRLRRCFPESRFYLDEGVIRGAIRTDSMFNVIDLTSGDKVDFWILTNSAFDESRFRRRRVERAFGLNLWVSSPEDTILAKLRWAVKSGGSEKQFLDALSVYELQSTELDLHYLDEWSRKLGVNDLLDRVKKQATCIEGR
jgi:hypothetical protein